MNNDFIQIKQLLGELKFSHKQRNLGVTVSTEEFVVQKPHMNVHILLEDIISIVPYRQKHCPVLRMQSNKTNNIEWINTHVPLPQYRIYVKKLLVHHRSGKQELKKAELVLPMHWKTLQSVSQYGELQSFN